MIKAVYDTNVVVAALLNPEGIPAFLLDLATQGRISLFLSPYLVMEYETVLRRAKFDFSPGRVTTILQAIQSHATLVTPRVTLQILSDSFDNHVLGCAVEAKADYLVTGNRRHFPFRVFQGIGIVSPRRFWEIYQESLEGDER